MEAKLKKHRVRSRYIIALIIAAAVGYVGAAFGVDTIADIATRVTGSFSALAKLITAIAYVAGLGFAVGSIFKFKAHKDNPTQIPIGTPIALLFVGAALVFMPNVFTATGQTVFGNTTAVGGSSGVDPFST
jgi:intracellular multiplication protein IcmD